MNPTEETPSNDTAGPTSAALGASLAAQAADSIDAVVGLVRDKTVRPVILVARGIVFGTIIAVVGVVMAFMILIALLRIFDVYVFSGRDWASLLLFGAFFLVIGAVLWRFTKPRSEAN